MGYTTDFAGTVEIDPPLNEHEISFLEDFNRTRRMHRTKGPLFVRGGGFMGQDNDVDVLDGNKSDPDQPGLWCQWVAWEDGTALEWDGGEKFYNAAEWMEYIVNKMLSPAARSYIDTHVNEDERLKHFTCNHTVNGEIYAEGEDSDDKWKIVVANNVVTTHEGRVEYGPVQEDPPTPEEVAAAIKSIGGGALKVKVWTLAVIDEDIVTSVHSDAAGAYEALRQNYTVEEAGSDHVAIIRACQKQGLTFSITDHELEVTL